MTLRSTARLRPSHFSKIEIKPIRNKSFVAV